MEARTCAPSAHTSCGGNRGTIPRVGQERFYCRSSCHRCTSAMVVEDGVARNEERVGPQTGSTGGRPRTPLRNSPPPSDGIQPPGTGEHA